MLTLTEDRRRNECCRVVYDPTIFQSTRRIGRIMAVFILIVTVAMSESDSGGVLQD